jgi:ribonuclease D
MGVSDETLFEYIESDARFTELCLQLSNSAAIAIDTEFVRTNTFYPQIGLLQLSNGSECYLIDPLAVSDWSCFKSLLSNPSCSFVIHSCSEDLNLLFTYLGVVPAVLFDTQLAASFLGFGFSLSYQNLVEEILSKVIDKNETRSDWLRRPLSSTQTLYAAIDVKYLNQLYTILAEALSDRSITHWFQAECNYQLKLASQSENTQNWKLYYSTVNNAWKLNDSGLGYLQNLCYWREQEARHRNRPRSWIAKDSDLFMIAEYLSSLIDPSAASLFQLKEIDRNFINRYNTILVDVALSNKFQESPINRHDLNKPLSALLRKKLKACKQHANRKAEELNIAPELLGRKKHLLILIKNFEQSGQLCWEGELAGWRRSILESEFNQIMGVVD